MSKRIRGNQRTRTGCIQCRTAKRKCDEFKPKCKSCEKKKINCFWPEAPTQSLNQFLDAHGLERSSGLVPTKGTRSRGGCLLCKKYKKKCDETKPVCLRCQKVRKLCAWPQSVEEILGNSPIIPSMVSISSAESSSVYTTKRLTILPDIVSRPIDTNPHFSHLFNIFFNHIIKRIVPQRSIKVLSEITLDSISQSSTFRSVFATFSIAYLYNSDTTKQKQLDKLLNQLMIQMIDPDDIERGTECKLHGVVFCLLRQIYSTSNNSGLIREVQAAYRILAEYSPPNTSNKFKLLVESFLYYFSVSIVVTPLPSITYDVYAICDKLRKYFPVIPTSVSNPLLGPYVEVSIIVAKASYLFKTKSNDFSLYHKLLDQVEVLLNSNFMIPKIVEIDDTSENIFTYADIVAIKILIFHCLPYQDRAKTSKLIKETLKMLPLTTGKSLTFELCSLWGLFMFGLNLEEPDDQQVIVHCLEVNYKKNSEIRYQKIINCLQYAWDKGTGFELLRDEEYISQLCLN